MYRSNKFCNSYARFELSRKSAILKRNVSFYSVPSSQITQDMLKKLPISEITPQKYFTEAIKEFQATKDKIQEIPGVTMVGISKEKKQGEVSWVVRVGVQDENITPNVTKVSCGLPLQIVKTGQSMLN